MIYPKNYEEKIGFAEMRKMLRGNCLCNLGWELVGEMSFSADEDEVRSRLAALSEFRKLKEDEEDLSLQDFYDVRPYVARLKLKGTYMEEQELFELMRCLLTVANIVRCIKKEDGSYPSLLTMIEGVDTQQGITDRLRGILDKYGHISDTASPELFHIRRELRRVTGTISQTLNSILRSAQMEGLIDKDVAPTMRDGRLVIPVQPAMKRRIQGIVHDESASGKTLFIEPTAVVEQNNRIRELEADARREIIRILKEMSDEIRPHADSILQAVRFLGNIDFLQAKAQLSEQFEAIEPAIENSPRIDFCRAYHPLLREVLKKQGKEIVPLDVELDKDSRILIISGPNAGGKSVCLKTVGLLQYMVQCGLSIPVSENSHIGLFKHILIDIGDEQSIEDDLSTYSSHLLNMKMMMRHADDDSLILIDEFGTGTEPQIGGAIAEAVLKQLWKSHTWGIITTHYQNLKHFADEHQGVINGAMMYDRHEMRALFQLQVGRPGSSFAIEIARKTGLPESVIADASEIVGQDYIQSDKYLQDIIRDKRYWEQKRQSVRIKEKEVERSYSQMEYSIEEIESERKAILRRAREQADELLREANRRIENTIREIREAEAEKNATRKLREEMREFQEEVKEIDVTAKDALIEKKMQQILARRQRHQERQEKKRDEERRKREEVREMKNDENKNENENKYENKNERETFVVGERIRIRGTQSKGYIDSLSGDSAYVIIGDMRTKMKTSKLEKVDGGEKKEEGRGKGGAVQASSATRNVMDAHRNSFRPEIDVRGMRGDEALLEVQHFIDDAILVGISNVRILHGKGNGILRSLIRQYLNTVPNVTSCRDEHVQFGGAGITVVEL